MYISDRTAATMAAFAEALLPDTAETSFADVRARLGATARELYDPRRFDDGLLRLGLPTVFRVFFWLPILCFWLLWKPLPFTRLSVRDRQRLFTKLEHSRIYALRGLYLTGKMFTCMTFFHDEATWAYIGFDGKGELPLTIVRTALDDLREGQTDAA